MADQKDHSTYNRKQLLATLAAMQAEKDAVDQEAASLRAEVAELRSARELATPKEPLPFPLLAPDTSGGKVSTFGASALGYQADRDQLLQDYRAMLSSLVEGVISLDSEGKLAYANASARNMLGWRRFEPPGQVIHDRIHPPRPGVEACSVGVCAILTALVSDETFGDEDVFFRSDGSSFPVRYTISPWRVRQRPMGAIITFRDVTEQKQAEERLEALQASFRATFEQLAVGIVHVNMSGTVRRANQFLAKMLGYLPDELVGLPSSDLAHPDDYAVAVDRVGKLIAGEGDSYPYETRMITKDGRILWTNVTGSLVRTVTGKPDYLLAVIERIDKRKELEQELVGREREATRQAAEVLAVLDAIPQPVVVISTQGQVVRVNARMQEYLEYLAIDGDERTLVQQAMAAIDVHSADGSPLDLSQRPLWRVLSGEVISPDNAIEIHIVERSGTERYVSVTGAPVRNEAGEIVEAVCVFNDITGKRHLEHELANQVSQWEASFEAMTDGVLVVDVEGHVLWVNTAYRSLFASVDVDAALTSPDAARHVFGETLYDTLGRLVPQDETPIVRALLGDVLRGREAMDLVVIGGDGSEIPVIVTGSPIRDASGAITGAVCIYRDVRERRSDAIQTRDLLFELVQVAVAAASQDSGGRGASGPHMRQSAPALAAQIVEMVRLRLGSRWVGIIAVDPLSEAEYPLAAGGMSPEDEREWREEAARSSLADHFDAATLMRLRQGEVVIHDVRGETPEQEHRRILAAPVRVEGTLVGLLGCEQVESGWEYITAGDLAFVKAATQVAAQVIQAGRLHQSLAVRGNSVTSAGAPPPDALLSAVLHALDRPLARLREEQRLSSTAHTAPTSQAKAARLTADALRSLELQHHELRELAAMFDGTFTLSRARLDLGRLLEREVSRQRTRHKLRQIQFANEAGVFVHGDRTRLRCALGAVLHVAITATPPDLPVTVTIIPAGSFVRVSVRDGGAPLTRGDCEHFFDLLYQAMVPSRRASQQDGLGAALAICKAIVEAHGGTVEIESTGERGATLWVTLPLAETDQR